MTFRNVCEKYGNIVFVFKIAKFSIVDVYNNDTNDANNIKYTTNY